MRVVVDYARKAHEGNKADVKVREHYEMVKRE
jgi:hypothetical protein